MRITASAALVILALGAAAFMRPEAATDPASHTAIRAPFVETLVEPGTVTAARIALYGAPLGAAGATIVEIVAEGSAVEPGDLLVRLDTAPLEQLLVREHAALRRAEVELEADRARLRLEARSGRLELMEAEAALAEAGREVARARAEVEDFRPMLAEGFITRPEFDRAEQALVRAGEQRQLALARRDLHASAQTAAPAADGRPLGTPSEALVDEIRLRIEALQRQIALSTVRAGTSGLVVYRELFFGSERRKPQVGDDALPNQPLIAVPDASGLLVETRVREIDLHRVAPGQPVTVRVDAYPGLTLAGRIDVIGALAQADAARAGTKYFPVSVRLDQSDPRLRSGMTAQVRIEVAEIPAAVLLPLPAIFEDDAGTYCFVIGADGGVARRAVEIWGRNETHAAIRAGVAPGERVMATGPPR